MGSSVQEGGSFSVSIIASCPLQHGLVHAIEITQPVQSWTVIRGQDDFRGVSDALSSYFGDIPECPTPPTISDRGIELNTLTSFRNDLQQWLAVILTHAGARDSPAVQNFFTYAANIMPPQFADIPWTSFTAMGAPLQTPQLYTSGASQVSEPTSTVNMCGNLDEMDMDDMFATYDDTGAGPADDDSDEDEDDEDYLRPSVRYQQTDEAVTEEDEMDMMQIAGEAEMIDDLGSFAQSLGASHLGRSLQLQAEIGKRDQDHQRTDGAVQGQVGLTLGGAVTGTNKGGIGGAMERAGQHAGDSFHHISPESPPRLDSFKMMKVIGKGSFGKVFLVKEIKTGQMYALKVLRKDNIVRRNQVEHTRTERSVLGYVKHPFIVGMNMAFQSKDKLYFVLDYCAGGELFFHLGKLGSFPEPRARFYAAEIILAISYVHSLDIIYRDLKPENVLLDSQGHIRLTDFGLSKEGISSSSSGANSFCGTPEYLAPEILDRKGHGRAVDWWSLGALLYEMLTGLPPFYCRDRERLFEKIKGSELHYPASLSRPAKGVLKGLLTKDPKERLGSGPEDAADIQRHEFFNAIDWDKLQHGEMSPPWKPQINGTLDTSQFDKEFTSMPVFSPHSMQRANGFGATPTSENLFEGFTFTDRALHGPGA